MLLSAEHLSKNYGMKTLLEDASIYLEQGEKIGVIGINGTGKSTLLRLLSGTEAPDEGAVRRDPNVQVSYLRQNPEMNPNASILEQVFLGFPGDFRELKEFEAKTMLTKLGLTDYDQKIGTLSGGQRKRVALCTALIHPADVLLLDEPTNHLDAYMVEWLEQWLRNFRGGIIMVTHDRYFLERVCNRICQVERGKLYFYEANYSKYLELRQQRYDYAQAAERKRQTLLRREYQWIIRGPQARGTKAKDRIRRYAELKAQDTPETQGTVQTAAMSSRLGKKTIELVNVEKSYDGREILKPFSYLLGREDRIGVVGRNGAGKSTLLELIAGKIQPTAGEITWGETVKIGYFSQEGRELDLNQRPYDYIHEIAATVKTAEGTFSASQMLERFLFDGDLQYSTIGALSGGERRRLYLLGVLAAGPQCAAAGRAHQRFGCGDPDGLGGLSGDLRRRGGGRLAMTAISWIKSPRRSLRSATAARCCAIPAATRTIWKSAGKTLSEVKEKKEKKETPREPKPQKLRFSYKEQREYAVIEDEIAQLEEKIAQADADMAANATDYTALQRLTEEKEQLETALEEKMGRWMYLSELAEKIEAQKES